MGLVLLLLSLALCCDSSSSYYTDQPHGTAASQHPTLLEPFQQPPQLWQLPTPTAFKGTSEQCIEAQTKAQRAGTEAQMAQTQAQRACTKFAAAALWRRRRSAPQPTAPTNAPTNAPNPPTNAPTLQPFPDRTELDPICNVYVSNTAGADSDSCGQTSSSACGSIQKGIDLAGAYNTVCVESGI